MTVYKNETRGTWYCIFRYRNYTGKNVQKKKEGFARRRDAVDYETDYKNKFTGTCDITFTNLTKVYRADIINRQKPTTYKINDYVIKKILLPYFGSLAINKITPLIVRQWQNKCLIGKYKAGTAKNYNVLLGSIMRYAAKYYGLSDNPVDKAGILIIPDRYVPEHRLHFWTQEQFEKFNQHTKRADLHLIFDILFYCGLRRGEALGLRLKDVDMQTNIIHVTKNRVSINGQKLTIQTPKTKTPTRDVSFPNKIAEEISKYVATLYKPEPNDLLVDITPAMVTANFRNQQKKLNITTPIRLHDLRHSHASLLIDLGFSVQAVADRLGHSNANEVIKTYGHLYPTKRDAIIEALNRL